MLALNRQVTRRAAPPTPKAPSLRELSPQATEGVTTQGTHQPQLTRPAAPPAPQGSLPEGAVTEGD